MKELNPSDLFEVRPQALFSSNDYEYLVDLYAPIIGIKSVAVLLALLRVNQDEVISHKSFLERNKITITDLSDALEGLEAIGLVSTYRKSEQNYRYFVYCLFSPRTPKEFFDNVLFAGTLTKAIGETEANKIAEKYQVSPIPEDLDNASTTFQEYFHPNYDDEVYGKSEKKAAGRTIGKVLIDFDRNKFMMSLRSADPRFDFDSFSKTELIKIARMSALFNYDEDGMAYLVRESFSFKKKVGERVDFAYLKQKIYEWYNQGYDSSIIKKDNLAHGNSEAAKSIRKMERLTTVQYLKQLQKGNKPAKPDLDLITSLRVDIGLPDPVINALLLYVLINKGNTLPRAYTEKLAASLVREGVSTALDAMNYFTRIESEKGKKTTVKKDVIPSAEPAIPTAPAKEVPSKNEKPVTQEEIDDFLDNLDFGD